jgi:hypothetical protein
MILVPENASAQMASSVKSVQSIQSQLDQEMEEILNRKGLSSGDKWKMFQQVLNRYLHHTPSAQKPLALPIIDPIAATAGSFEYILESVPKTLMRKTGLLLNLMQASNRISWNKTGTVTIDNNSIPGSNIIDLVNDVVRKRTISKNPVGINIFKQFLQDINIPKELVSFQFGAGHVKKSSSNNFVRKLITKKRKRVSKKRNNILKNYKEYIL